MSEVHTWLFLVIAIVLAIVVGRLGTVLRERIKPTKITRKKVI